MNRELLINACVLIAGATIGSVATWRFLKTKYDQLNKEDLESMREYYEKKYNTQNESYNDEEVKEEDEKDPSDRSLEEIRGIVNDLGYKKDSDVENKNEEEEEDDMLGPEYIAPEETWERDYPTLSLTYFEGDGVLANDDGKIIDNVDELVGEDFASHFGEYEDDSVYVRNEKMKVQYEILRDYGSYSENYY